MDYKSVGSSGLKVSALCLGKMTFGNEADEAASKSIYHASRDAGINFYDTAMTEQLRAKITAIAPELELATGHRKGERS